MPALTDMKETYPRIPMGQTDFSELSFGSELAHRFGPTPRVYDVKEKSAEDIRLALGATTLAQEYACQGQDWEKVMAQRILEKEEAAELGIGERGAIIQLPPGVTYSQMRKMVGELETLSMGMAIPAISRRRWWQELGALLRRMGFRWPI